MSRQCPHVSLQSIPNDPLLQAKNECKDKHLITNVFPFTLLLLLFYDRFITFCVLWSKITAPNTKINTCIQILIYT